MAGYPKEIVEKSKQDRMAFQKEGRSCPSCGEAGFDGVPSPPLSPCGGPGSYWIEHSCGAYSQLMPTLEEAYDSEWVKVDADLNASMHPPVGG